MNETESRLSTRGPPRDPMPRENFSDMLAFLAVARERSFTRAAAQLGVSQSALSHRVKALEARLGVRLLTRTTRSVAPSEAGERLMHTVAPRLQEIEAEIDAISELGDKPAGIIRITAIEHVVDTVLWPRLAPVIDAYPEVRLEISAEYRMVDIVAERYDIGVRYGDQVHQDMVAVRLTPDVPMTIVGAPRYFATHRDPVTVKDLMRHNCISLRLANSGGLYAWELSEGGQPVEARVGGQVVFNGTYQILNAALSGHGLAFLPADLTRPHIEAGALRAVMADRCPNFAGLYAYYPSQRHSSLALRVVIDAIRHKA